MYLAGSISALQHQSHDQRPTCHELVAAYEQVLPGKLIKNGANWEGPLSSLQRNRSVCY